MKRKWEFEYFSMKENYLFGLGLTFPGEEDWYSSNYSFRFYFYKWVFTISTYLDDAQ